MGYMRHHGILVTGYDEKHVRKARKRAREIIHPALVSKLAQSVINGYYSFAIFPDGSKEGWDESNSGDQDRATFIDWMREARDRNRKGGAIYLDWVEVQYGDGELETFVTASSDDDRKAALARGDDDE